MNLSEKIKTMTNEEIIAAEKVHDETYNEGKDGYNPYREAAKQASIQLDKERVARKIAEEEEAAFEAEWAAETTKERRAIWNEAITTSGKTQMTWKELQEIQKAMGFTLEDLKKAVALNKEKTETTEKAQKEAEIEKTTPYYNEESTEQNDNQGGDSASYTDDDDNDPTPTALATMTTYKTYSAPEKGRNG